MVKNQAKQQPVASNITTENVEKKAKKAPVQKHTMPAIYRVLFSFLLLVFASVIFTWFLLWRQNLCDAEVTNEFIQEHQDITA